MDIEETILKINKILAQHEKFSGRVVKLINIYEYMPELNDNDRRIKKSVSIGYEPMLEPKRWDV